jgi:hypothetical protein
VKSKITFVFVVASLLCGCKPSAPASKKDNTAISTNVAAQAARTNADLGMAIPAFDFFKGIPFQALKKTQFESTNEYVSRIQQIPLPASPTWIVVDTNAVSLTYDAENKICQACVYKENSSLTDTITDEKQAESDQRLIVFTFHGDIQDRKVVDQFELTIQNPMPAELTTGLGIMLAAPMGGSHAKELFEAGNLRMEFKIAVNNLTNAHQFIEYKHSDQYGYWIDMAQDVPVNLLGAKLIDVSSGTVISSWEDLTIKQ